MITKALQLIVIIFLLGTIDTYAQTVGDAVRYSNTNFIGTARSAGVGNSFGSMGGDFGVVSLNPAGIADFWKSDFMFSFSFNNIQNRASLNKDPDNVNTDKVTNRLFLENIGSVFSHRPHANWSTSNLAIALNQIGNLTENIYYEGNTEGSITERFVELANATSFNNGVRDPNFLDNFESGLAFDAGAIYSHPNEDLEYVSDFFLTDIVRKSQSITRSGRINEFSVAWAGKYKNTFGVGIALGIPFISFEENKTYTERDPTGEIPVFESLVYEENLVTSGTGVNLKIGFNTSIAKVIRLGFAFHTPTYFSMQDQYTTNLRYAYNDGQAQSLEAGSPDGFFEYSYSAPMKLILSGGALLNLSDKLKGFVNADFEYKDYTQNSFGLGNDSNELEYERELNDQISQQLSSAYNLKVGGELAYDKYRFRAGANFIGSPYAVDDQNVFDNVYSFGLGFRGDQFYIDMAYVADRSETGYIPYLVSDETRNLVVTNDSKRNKVLFTVGFKF